MRTEECVRLFRDAFPTEQDYYTALGYFRASGLSETEAHATAEAVGGPSADRNRRGNDRLYGRAE